MPALAYFELKSAAIRQNAIAFIQSCADGVCVTFRDKARSLDQNDKVHPMVRDIQRQVLWMRSGRLAKLSEPQWRHFFAAHIRRESEMVRNIDDDGFIVLSVGSSELTARECSEMIELMYAFGSARDVVWSEKAKEHYAKYRIKDKAA